MPEWQPDLFKPEEKKKQPKILFDRKKIFGSSYVPSENEKFTAEAKFSTTEKSHPRHKHMSRAWEDLHGRGD